MIKIRLENDSTDKKYEVFTTEQMKDKILDIAFRAFRRVLVTDIITGEILLDYYISHEWFHREMWPQDAINIIQWEL